jgi:hypothetical protein
MHHSTCLSHMHPIMWLHHNSAAACHYAWCCDPATAHIGVPVHMPPLLSTSNSERTVCASHASYNTMC